jgi:PTS system nitrogen regulatory IIA component
MKIADFLAPADVLIDLKASDKAQLLKAIGQKAAATLNVAPESITSALVKREGLGSTGLGGGVAVPHARLDEVKAPYGLLARLRKPIQFDAIDGEPVDVVFLLLLPATPTADHLNALASVARALRNLDTLRALHRAGNSAELYAAITALG